MNDAWPTRIWTAYALPPGRRAVSAPFRCSFAVSIEGNIVASREGIREQGVLVENGFAARSPSPTRPLEFV